MFVMDRLASSLIGIPASINELVTGMMIGTHAATAGDNIPPVLERARLPIAVHPEMINSRGKLLVCLQKINSAILSFRDDDVLQHPLLTDAKSVTASTRKVILSGNEKLID
jgi:hypothetical protein